MTDRPVKITLPGPVTIGNACADVHYGNDRKGRGADIAEALNSEIKALADAGCRYVQIDEPGLRPAAPRMHWTSDSKTWIAAGTACRTV